MLEQAVKVYSPETEQAASEVLAQANREGWAINLQGGGTKQNMGNPLTHVDAVVSSQKLNKVLAYQPEDLTVTVQAGITFEQLEQVLAEHGQWLPLDPPRLKGATLGGMMATDVSGAKRLLYGTARDLLIGAKFVLADGTVGKSGGYVVKNVTGYDLHKLMIGSFGTLAMLTELTFKVLPKPQATGWGVAHFDNPVKALEVARTIARSNLSPTALELALPNSPGVWLLNFAADGLGVAVKNQLAGMQQICEKAGAGDVHLLNEGDSKELWDYLRRAPGYNQTVLRFGTRPTDLPLALQFARHSTEYIVDNRSYGEQSSLLQNSDEPRLQIRAGTGLLYWMVAIPPEQNQLMTNPIKQVRQELAKIGGNLVIESAPEPLREMIDSWGDKGSALTPMLDLKNKLDLNNILNPGRFSFNPEYVEDLRLG